MDTKVIREQLQERGEDDLAAAVEEVTALFSRSGHNEWVRKLHATMVKEGEFSLRVLRFLAAVIRGEIIKAGYRSRRLSRSLFHQERAGSNRRACRLARPDR